MMLTRNRTRRVALLAGKALVLILLLVSPRALFASTTVVNKKSQDSKRPKTPKNVVRAEPVRIPAAEKQGHSPAPERAAAATEGADTGLSRSSRILALPRKAFTQLTKPEYLKSYVTGVPNIPLSPPV